MSDSGKFHEVIGLHHALNHLEHMPSPRCQITYMHHVVVEIKGGVSVTYRTLSAMVSGEDGVIGADNPSGITGVMDMLPAPVLL